MTLETRRKAIAIAAMFVALGAGASSAEPDESWSGSDRFISRTSNDWRYGGRVGAELQGKTDLDGGGDFRFWMVDGVAEASRQLGARTRLAVRADYRAIGYDFDNIPSGAGTVDPWDTVHVIRFDPILTVFLDETWSLLGGPIFEYSGESGANFGNSVRGGGTLAVGYRRDGLFLAAGVLALTEIEKSARIQPFVVFDWQATDSLQLGLRGDTSRGGEVRAEYSITSALRAGVGLGFRRELFRLNDDNRNLPGGAPFVIRKGVGEESSTVAKLTMAYVIDRRWTLEAYGGLTLDGEFRLEDSDGRRIASSDYDDSGFGGLSIRANF